MTKKSLDVLKEPVHSKTLEKPRIRELQDDGKFQGNLLPEEAPLPKPPAKKRKKRFDPYQGFNPIKGAQQARKTAALRAKLRVIHDHIRTPTGDDVPPCDTCKTAACCQAFIVPLTQVEYDSGLYGDKAVEITPEVARQLRGKLLRPSTLGAPLDEDKKTHYYLEGRVGQPCPFLGADKRCTIYDIRPVTCRTYTCVKDPRITQDVRDGVEPIVYSDAYVEKYHKDA